MENGWLVLMAAAAGVFGAGLTLLLWMNRQNDVEVAGGKKVSTARRPTQARYKKYVLSYALGGFAGGALGFFGPEWHWTTMQILLAAGTCQKFCVRGQNFVVK